VRRAMITAAAVAAGVTLAIPAAQAGPNTPRQTGQEREYVVLYAEGTSSAAARDAVETAGGTVVRENKDIGLATVRSTNTRFAEAARQQRTLAGVASNRAIGRAPKATQGRIKRDAIEKDGGLVGKSKTAGHGAPRASAKAEPLAGRQWDMQQINATADGSHRVEPGKRAVRVGVLDTGIDGSHPDIAPNFDRGLSRNFTTDVPTDANGEPIDGPCEEEPDQSCNDPNDVDEDGHGTHVASTIASPANNFGVAGVAPNVTLVNLRAGQDSGFFFLQPSVDALTYAGNNGIDVVNMSYYIDPWLFNCVNNPADSPENQLEQRTIIQATQRALNFAHGKGVTLIGAAGNEFADYNEPFVDESSPDFADTPGEAPYTRQVPPSCISMPVEGEHVIPVSATGKSTRKSFYSSHGKGYIAVGAPGGATNETADNMPDPTLAVLAAYPENVARAAGELNPDGTPNTPRVVRDCQGSGGGQVCAYYQYIQGTSMASPHAVGVASLIVSKYGRRSSDGVRLDPRVTESVLRSTATPTACPDPRTVTYVYFVRAPDGSLVRQESTQSCKGPRRDNSWYGNGIVNALRAVR
jgi:hypothetical protein